MKPQKTLTPNLLVIVDVVSSSIYIFYRLVYFYFLAFYKLLLGHVTFEHFFEFLLVYFFLVESFSNLLGLYKSVLESSPAMSPVMLTWILWSLLFALDSLVW